MFGINSLSKLKVIGNIEMKKKKGKEKKAKGPNIYSNFILKTDIKVGDIIKLGKMTLRQYQSTQSAVANEISIFLNWIEQMQSLFLGLEAVSDRFIKLEIDKYNQEKLGIILLSVMRQFTPEILYLNVIYYPDEYNIHSEENILVEHKVYEEKQEMRITKVSKFNPKAYKKKYDETDISNMGMSILQHIGAKNIYTPLIIEKNNKDEKIVSKFFLDFKGKGELFNYNKKLIEKYPVGTVIYPFAVMGRVKFIFELKFQEEYEKDKTNVFVLQFLKHLRNIIDRIITQAYTIRTCKGATIYKRLIKRKNLNEITHSRKAIIFLDIFDYSKLSIYIKDSDKSEQENEETKVKFVNIFNYIVSEIVGVYKHSIIDKIVGDMHMIVLDEDETIEDEHQRLKELARRAFLISWNINLVLRSMNKKAKEIFEERNINILDPDIYNKLKKANAEKKLKLQLLEYPKPTEFESRKVIQIQMNQFLLYYYICRKFKIGGIQIRIGFNIGKVAEIFLGGIRLDHTYIGKHVDLAARMEHLGKKNVIKFPAKIYSIFDEEFKLFIVKQITKENKLHNTHLTMKMMFKSKREYPKGFEKEGLATIEFFMGAGYIFAHAYKTYEKLERYLYELKPSRLNKHVKKYIEQNKNSLILRMRQSNPEKFNNYPDNDIIQYIVDNKPTMEKIEKDIESKIIKKIRYIIQEIKPDYDIYYIVRTLVLNKGYEFYKKYFPSEDRMSVFKKQEYFTHRLTSKISNNIDFRSVDADDLDRIVTELYVKLTGKPE